MPLLTGDEPKPDEVKIIYANDLASGDTNDHTPRA